EMYCSGDQCLLSIKYLTSLPLSSLITPCLAIAEIISSAGIFSYLPTPCVREINSTFISLFYSIFILAPSHIAVWTVRSLCPQVYYLFLEILLFLFYVVLTVCSLGGLCEGCFSGHFYKPLPDPALPRYNFHLFVPLM